MEFWHWAKMFETDFRFFPKHNFFTVHEIDYWKYKKKKHAKTKRVFRLINILKITKTLRNKAAAIKLSLKYWKWTGFCDKKYKL